MRRIALGFLVCSVCSLWSASSALAQEESAWGVQASLTPEWRSIDFVREFLGAERLDLSGSDFMIGFARGRMRSGHWGVSFLRQEWRDAWVCENIGCYGATGSLQLRGIAANWFVPVGSPFAGDRLQVGMHVDVGAGWFHGNVRLDEVLQGGPLLDSDRVGEVVPIHEVLDGWESALPLFRAEVAVAVIVAPGLKVIGSGGWGFPFRRRIGISVAYFQRP